MTDMTSIGTITLLFLLFLLPVVCFICRYFYYLIFFKLFFDTLKIDTSIWRAAFIAAFFGNPFSRRPS